MALLKKNRFLLIGLLTGVLYGLATRIVFGERASLASISYLFIVPAILGVVPLLFANNEQLRSYRNVIFIPWLTVATFFLTMVLVGLEEFICLLILFGPFFIIGTLSAFVYRLIFRNEKKKPGKMLPVVLLPLIIAPAEAYFKSPSAIYRVESEVFISASADSVWNNIVAVRPIQESEYNSGFFQKIGIPRPISARVSKKEMGGQRIGNFEGGLRFVETITQFEQNHKVGFDIRVDPTSVRPNVFDQHVLNGNYFSFVNATYELLPQPDGSIKLRLSSQYQLTSKINFYGRFWGDLILKDFQDRLLQVIKGRCEQRTQLLRG